jgi:proteic killer suppression protein
MIVKFRHKGLKQLYDEGNPSKLPASQVDKIILLLSQLDAAKAPEELNISGYGFHSLSGNFQGFYALIVNKNYRIIFRFDGKNATDVDYLDYH